MIEKQLEQSKGEERGNQDKITQGLAGPCEGNGSYSERDGNTLQSSEERRDTIQLQF